MPPKKRKSAVIMSESATPAPEVQPTASASGTQTPSAFAQSRSEAAQAKEAMIEANTYMYTPRPFKNPLYNKNRGRRMKNYKAVLLAERERDLASGTTEPTCEFSLSSISERRLGTRTMRNIDRG